jgi:hypothetical protein
MSKYQTLVILASGLEIHPREVVIDGVIYEVVASAEGHSLAEMNPYESVVTEIRMGEHEEKDADDMATLAEEVTAQAKRQRENGYDE